MCYLALLNSRLSLHFTCLFGYFIDFEYLWGRNGLELKLSKKGPKQSLIASIEIEGSKIIEMSLKPRRNNACSQEEVFGESPWRCGAPMSLAWRILSILQRCILASQRRCNFIKGFFSHLGQFYVIPTIFCYFPLVFSFACWFLDVQKLFLDVHYKDYGLKVLFSSLGVKYIVPIIL